MLHALRAELGRDSCVKRFAEARRRIPALSAFQSPAEVVAELERDGRGLAPVREPLIWALILEQRTCPHPVWAAVLCLIFAPMLRVLRGSIRPRRLTADELNQLIITTFLFLVVSPAAVPSSDHVSFHLRRLTRGAVFDILRRLQKEQQGTVTVAPDDLAFLARGAGPCDVFCPPRGASAAEEADALVELLHDALGDGPRPAHLDLVIDTTIRGEPLGDYVRRHHPVAPERDYLRIYERLKRRRTRAANRLRKPLMPLRAPPPEPLWP